MFDIESEISELRQRAHKIVTSTVLDSKGWQQQLNQIVISYLVHHGHSATAQILARDMDTAIDEPEPTIIKRQQIRKCTVARACDCLSLMFPTLRVSCGAAPNA